MSLDTAKKMRDAVLGQHHSNRTDQVINLIINSIATTSKDEEVAKRIKCYEYGSKLQSEESLQQEY